MGKTVLTDGDSVKNMPLVSVVIPTYNRAHLVGRAIKSVLDQMYQNLEIIIVDDGSEDDTEKIVKSFNDSRIIFTRHERNKGVSAARNTGIKLCSGNYIAFQDSDDEWLADKIRKQITVFLKSSDESIGVVYSGFFKIKDNIKTYIPSRECKKEGDIYFELLKENLIDPPAAMVKKICFEKVGLFDENLSTLEDWELFIRISKFFKFKYIPEALVLSYYTPNGVNERDEEHKLKTYNAIVNRNMDKLSENKRLLYNFYSSIWCINFSLGKNKSFKYKTNFNMANDFSLKEDEKYSINGIHCLRNSLMDEAKKQFNLALEKNSLNIDAQFCLGAFDLLEANFSRAVDRFNFLLNGYLIKNPINLACLYNNLGIALIKIGQEKEGKSLIIKAYNLNNHYIDAIYNMEKIKNNQIDFRITRKLIFDGDDDYCDNF